MTPAGPDALYVLDAGLKPFTPSAPNRSCWPWPSRPRSSGSTWPAAPPAVTRVSEPGQMVFPTGMVADGDRLVICDPGQPEVAQLLPVLSRLRPFHLDVVVHFVDGLLPADPEQRNAVAAPGDRQHPGDRRPGKTGARRVEPDHRRTGVSAMPLQRTDLAILQVETEKG